MENNVNYKIISFQPNISKSASFKYIPFDVLLTVLMAEKDAYIQELLDRQDEKSTNGEGKVRIIIDFILKYYY